MNAKRISFWLVGTITAFSGVGVAKVLAPSLPQTQQLTAVITGISMSILGLFIITLGTWRKK